MHGIKVNRKRTDESEGSRGSEIHLRRISIHYEDGGMMTFIPDAGHQFFAKDDLARLAGLMHKCSSGLEWGVEAGGVTDTQQGAGLA